MRAPEWRALVVLSFLASLSGADVGAAQAEHNHHHGAVRKRRRSTGTLLAPRRQLNGQACTSLTTTAMQLLRDELAAARREHAAHMQKLRVKFAQEVYIARKTQRQLQLV